MRVPAFPREAVVLEIISGDISRVLLFCGLVHRSVSFSCWLWCLLVCGASGLWLFVCLSQVYMGKEMKQKAIALRNANHHQPTSHLLASSLHMNQVL